jgi:hypothetical protein
MILILFLITMLATLIIITHCSDKTTMETMVDIPPIYNKITWSMNNKCIYKLSSTIDQILKKHGIDKTKNNEWELYIPCTYNDMNKEIKDIYDNTIMKNNNVKRFFIMDGVDELCGKNTLWKNIVNSMGRQKAIEMMPVTYRLNDASEMQLFKKEFNKSKLYILKKNIQRQEGLHITSDRGKIMEAKKDNFVVVQELLQDPYLIDGRKINMRFYMLIVCKDGEIDAYIHNNGFMYYTKDKFIKGSKKDGSNITTGYIDRKVYDTCPLTHRDFRNYLDKKYEPIKMSSVFFDRVYELLSNVVSGMDTVICNGKLKNNLTFQLFGVDVAVNDKLEPQIMEINKGPDLGAKDKRDKEVKYNVVEDMLKVMKVIPNINHGFIAVLQ